MNGPRRRAGLDPPLLPSTPSPRARVEHGRGGRGGSHGSALLVKSRERPDSRQPWDIATRRCGGLPTPLMTGAMARRGRLGRSRGRAVRRTDGPNGGRADGPATASRLHFLSHVAADSIRKLTAAGGSVCGQHQVQFHFWQRNAAALFVLVLPLGSPSCSPLRRARALPPGASAASVRPHYRNDFCPANFARGTRNRRNGVSALLFFSLPVGFSPCPLPFTFFVHANEKC